MSITKTNLTKKPARKRKVLSGVAILAFTILILFSGLKVWIKTDANSFAEEVSKDFQKDKTAALIAVIDSENYTLKDKNKAIWALGVLKEKEALSKLESLVTNEECMHEKDLCQYEINKATKKINGKH